ncbi:cyclodeaminase/cyclohydrolase family protein [Lacrimispora saccharolytica]|uniref:Formiminotransferase-cyclodeaminase n=1 Tax=Lacrimispora saccharolytica (strain ATCC 35040 / DSM 2544 / NRCC 2533 / WM1) TaxID=610130 RepID=D9R7M2_LACSW|nr:cyclodeaminase/cyclohydrolase family protein [Lacrimispora saccharolytica]ADL03751.1 Formiminotransferase-cyclodeaminase [[Clostridium] saccharolyticum WM1]QRV18118.1 cyclodeaminase/cyclohydrolase family protein [Lacrimispora saccharolytica]
MLEKSCNIFIEELSSKSPVPGGGGASAYVGALGMALGCMVGNLTLGKKKYQEVEPDIIKLLEKSEKIIIELKELVSKDAEVFYPLSQAYGLPQNTEEEKAEKEAVLQHALIAATKVPLDIAKTCLEAIELIEEYAIKGTRIAVSDAGVGAIFCKAALQGAKLNVLINTKIMKDQELKNVVESELSETVRAGMEKADRIYQYVETLLKS